MSRVRKWKDVPGKLAVEIEEGELVLYFRSSGYYDPGCFYLRNGDPGYPPEGDDERTLEYAEVDGLRQPKEVAEALFTKFYDEVCEVELEPQEGCHD